MENGFIIINKPSGWTSHDVVAKLRGITKIRKIGHCGTLDPLATGVLIVAIGRNATKKIDQFHQYHKTYVADLEFGLTTDTYDIEGEVISKIPANKLTPISKSELKKTLDQFIGLQEQLPPAFSAKKIHGTPAYKLARAGKTVELKPTKIEISKITLINYNFPQAQIEVECSTGTYIRSLIHDLGQKIKYGAIMTDLQRTAIGPYQINQSVLLTDLTFDNWGNYLIIN